MEVETDLQKKEHTPPHPVYKGFGIPGGTPGPQVEPFTGTAAPRAL